MWGGYWNQAYYPSRLNIDTDAASQMNDNPAAKVLGLRLRHLKDVNIPYYAFQTSLMPALPLM